MSLLMEALKKAEAAKSASSPVAPIEDSPAANIAVSTDISTDELDEIGDEVNAWQQQLLAEATARTELFTVASSESETTQLVTEAEDTSPLIAAMLATESTPQIDWEAGILPEFQAVLAAEVIAEPVVLEDTQSTIHWEEEPSVALETEQVAAPTPAPTLNFSREIVPDLSLNIEPPASSSHLKLDWDDDILTSAPIPPVAPVFETVTTPNVQPPVSTSISQEKPAAQQRDEAKRLFKAAATRRMNYWWISVAMSLLSVGILGFYALQNQALLTYYMALWNHQFTDATLVVNLPPTYRPPNVTPHPVESTPIKPATPAKPSETPPTELVVKATVPPNDPKPPAPLEFAAKTTVTAPPNDPKPNVTPPTSPPVALQKPVEKPVVKPVVKPRSPPKIPKATETPDNAIATIQRANNKDIKITRSSLQPHLHQNLTQAYTAFQRGENSRALAAYQSVLQQEPRNRDALLGIAAIAVRQHNYPQATRHYQAVLRYYPQDPVAQTNLLSMTEQTDGGEDRETQLKTLAHTTPQPAYIYFQLGLVYAQQNRWNEAQQAFFEAYRIDSQQADYAYNLAVSLEYLHQSQAAVTYYQRAVQLQQKQGKSSSFEPKVAQQRIATLKTATGGHEVASLLDNDVE